MTALRITLAIVLAFGVGALAFSQSPPGSSGRNTTVATNLRIVSPQDGQKLPTNYVTIQYQVTNRAAAANNLPTFNVSLDGGDPVQTSTMSHTFTGLAPGQHTIAVQMVDANSLPVAGTLTQVHFVIAAAEGDPAKNGVGPQAQQNPQVRDISAVSQQSAPSHQEGTAQSTNAQDGNLPSSGSALPLLSVIGFGVLVGGIASALKTR